MLILFINNLRTMPAQWKARHFQRKTWHRLMAPFTCRLTTKWPAEIRRQNSVRFASDPELRVPVIWRSGGGASGHRCGAAAHRKRQLPELAADISPCSRTLPGALHGGIGRCRVNAGGQGSCRGQCPAAQYQGQTGTDGTVLQIAAVGSGAVVPQCGRIGTRTDPGSTARDATPGSSLQGQNKVWYPVVQHAGLS